MLDPYLRQEHFRFRNDDGDEAGASWSDNIDTDKSTLLDPAGALDARKCRVRFAIYEVNGETARKSEFSIIQRVNGGAWSIPAQVDVPLMFFDSTFITGAPATTQQISSGGFTAGQLYDAGSVSAEVTIEGNTSIEFEMCMALDETQLDVSYTWGDYVELGIIYFDGTSMDEYLFLAGINVKANVKVYTMNCESGSFNMDGHTAEQKKDSVEKMGSGDYAYLGQDIIMRKGIPVPMESTNFAFNGQDIDMTRKPSMQMGSSSFAFNGGSANLMRNFKMQSEATNYPFVGGDIDFTHTRKIIAISGDYNVNGGDADLVASRRETLASGIYGLNGGDVAFRKTFVEKFEDGSYDVNGGELSFSRSYAMAMESGSFIVQGQPVILAYSEEGQYEVIALGASFPYIGGDVSLLRKNLHLSCESGAFNVVGGDLGHKRRKNMVCESGSFAFNGGDLTYARRKTMIAEGGQYLFVGGVVGLAKQLSYMGMGSGQFPLVGEDLGFGKLLKMRLEGGQYTVNLYPINALRNYKIPMGSGEFSVSYNDTGLLHNKRMPMDSGEFVVDGGEADMYRSYKLHAEGGNYQFRGFPILMKYSAEVLLADRWCFNVNLGWQLFAPPSITNNTKAPLFIDQEHSERMNTTPYSMVDYSIKQNESAEMHITDYQQIDLETFNGCK